MRYRFALVLLLLNTLTIQAQFILNGQAELITKDCYQLTVTEPNAVGSIWHVDKISLENSFEVVFELNFGCKDDDGADGIVFGFQPLSTDQGSTGGTLGFGGIEPSIGIEFDTYQNNTGGYNDPVFDHIAILKNGNVSHSGPDHLAGPVFTGTMSPNIEDCLDHSVRVIWDADNLMLSVYFDCILSLTYSGDIVNEIFGGDPEVFWGFTASTGGLNNNQTVCLTYSTFLDAFQDINLCPGSEVELNATGGIVYQWSPTDGLSNPNIPNPIANPIDTTVYQVAITDLCERTFYQEITINVGGEPVALELGNDTLLCEGIEFPIDATCENCSYLWSDNTTTAINIITDPGTYSVTLSNENCNAFDKINIEYLKIPTIDFGNDTTLCLNQKLILNPNFDAPALYQWQDNSPLEEFIVLKAGTYSLVMNNDCGEDYDEIEVDYEDCHQFYCPNIFSPNADLKNDYFTIYSNGDVVHILELVIFDRWGNAVFQNNNFQPNEITAGWDGFYGKRKAAIGVYTCMIKLLFKDDTIEVFHKSLTLIR